MKPLISLLILLAAGSAHADWTLFRGNPQLTGVATTELPTKMVPLWTVETGGIESTPAIAAGTVYIASLDKFLYAIELQSGKLKWKYEANDEIKSSPSVYENTVYFGDELGVFHAIDAASGKKKWEFRADAGIISSANFSGDRVVFGSYDNNLYCLSLKDGSLLWKLETAGYVHATPAIEGENVVVTGCDGKLRIVRLSDGKEVSAVDLGAYVAASPALSNGHVYVGTFGNQILSVDLAAKKIAWQFEDTSKKFPFYASAAVTKNLVAVGGRDKVMRGLDPQSGKIIWEFSTKARIDASPVIAGQNLLFGNLAGELFTLDTTEGKQVWKYDIGSAVLGSPAVSERKVVIGSKDGVVYCFGEKSQS
ncbi:MAG TPA: PQQ-binding-like beta-propeller repeat protein [Acidobacteriota bacterium]|nr:PQQ-binding-like beta-propeller repeat protein [Acidobacteriota bacterium]